MPMSPSILLAILFAAFLHALWNIIVKSGENKLFDATLALRRAPLSRRGLAALLARWPWMTLKVLLGIYWQALRLFIKRTPVFTHPESRP